MFISLPEVLVILEHYKYFLIFPIMVIEGPIIAVISGFMAYLGILNIFLLYPLLVLGDLIGDSLYYAIGKYCSRFRLVKKLVFYLGYSEKSEEFLKSHFDKHMTKTLLLAKLSHGLGGTVQVTAGIAKVNFPQYISIELVGTMIKTLFLLVLGFYLGNSYEKINTYLDSIAFMVISVTGFIFFGILLNKYIKNYFR